MQLYNLTTVWILKKKKGGVHVDKMAMFPPFHKNIWASISTLDLEGNKLMQTGGNNEDLYKTSTNSNAFWPK